MTGEGHKDWISDCDFHPGYVYTCRSLPCLHFPFLMFLLQSIISENLKGRLVKLQVIFIRLFLGYNFFWSDQGGSNVVSKKNTLDSPALPLIINKPSFLQFSLLFASDFPFISSNICSIYCYTVVLVLQPLLVMVLLRYGTSLKHSVY